MTDVTIPGIGQVTFPESMSLADIEKAAQGLSSRVGKDSQGNYNADLALLDRQMTNTQPGEHQTAPIGTWLDNNMTPEVVGATIGSVATGGMGAIPAILAAGAGGGGGAALQEAQNPRSTAQTIGKKALLGGLRQAGAEVAGLGASAFLGRILAPNITPLRTLSEKAQDLAGLAKNALSSGAQSLPEDSMLGALSSKAQALVTRFAEPAEHLMHAADKLGTFKDLAEGHLLAAALGGPIGWGTIAAKQLVSPGALMRYLIREPLSVGTQEVVKQAVTVPIRAGLGGAEKAWDGPYLPLEKPPELGR